MRQIHQQYQSQQQEQYRTHQRDIVPPDLEEAVRDQEADHNQPQPRNDLRSPESVLNRRARIFRRIYPQQHDRQHGMEQSQGEVDAVYSGEPEAFVPGAVDGDVVEQDALQLLDGPGGEHQPGQHRVDEQDEGVGDPGRDAVVALAAGRADGAAGRGAAARGGGGHDGAHGGDCQERQR